MFHFSFVIHVNNYCAMQSVVNPIAAQLSTAQFDTTSSPQPTPMTSWGSVG